MSQNDNIGDDNISNQSEFERVEKIKRDLERRSRNNPSTNNRVAFSMSRYLGFNRTITVNNISGKDSWIILSPAPIFSISSFSLDNVGEISFNNTGDYKCQQSPLKNESARKFYLDNNQLYYSVFFNCDGVWKAHFKDRKIDATKYDINLLERHVGECVDYEFVSKL